MNKIRKVLLTLCAVAATALSASAQRLPAIEWGVVGGVNMPNFSTPANLVDIQSKLGWQVGMITAVKFGGFALEPQILYVRQGVRIDTEHGTELNLKANSIDVPLLFSVRLLNPFRFYLGPVFTVMNDCKQKSGGDLLDFGRLRPTLSFAVGAGVKLPGSLLIDFRFNGQFRPKQDVVLPNGDNVNKLRCYNFALSLGYLF